jgi:cyclophilin family peptidyl-prolyl cis-trans isomerase
MRTHARFSPEEERRLAHAIAENDSPICPRCETALDEWPISPRRDVSYVRDRLWLVCPACGATAVLDRRGRPAHLHRPTGTAHGVVMANPTVTIETNHGIITAEMFADVAPKTAGNFIELAKKGFYDGVIFHRVIQGFMIQGGDPTGTGRGGPGYQIEDEFAKGLAHTHAGTFSMANAGPNTGGSQFFITLAATPWLDGKHAIFGKVTAGLDVVKAIGKLRTGAGDRPVEDVVMQKVTVSDAD